MSLHLHVPTTKYHSILVSPTPSEVYLNRQLLGTCKCKCKWCGIWLLEHPNGLCIHQFSKTLIKYYQNTTALHKYFLI